MLCPPITEHSWDPMTVDEDQEQEEKKEEEEDNMKALSCMDLVRRLLNNLSAVLCFHSLLQY